MVNKGMFIGERYEILEKAGTGGMADVYKAKDHKLNRFVAVKILKSEFSEDKSFVSKFKIEAQSSAGLTHPNIVNVYDVGESNGLYYIVMELVEGITLKRYIERKGKLPVKEAVSIAIQVAQGIEAAHNNHIIHRDIKPQNILISREGKVKVADFGIARAASANTINSNAMGSVHYISPEQARNGYVDEKSDIYSLGITLYEMIAGEVPFEGDSAVTVALQHVQEDIPVLSTVVSDIPVSVDKIVGKCTQKKPDRRYLKVSSLIADLKKSLVSPDEDFVQLAPDSNNSHVVMIMGEEVGEIKREAGIEDIDKEIEGLDIISPVKRDINLNTNNNNHTRDSEEDMYDDFEGKNAKFDKAITIGSIIAAVVILVAGIFIFVSLLSSEGCTGSKIPTLPTTTPGNIERPTEEQTTISNKSSVVPSLTNKTEDQAIKALQEAGLQYKIVEYRKDNTIPKGRVIEQSPKAGDIVDRGSTINLVVSDGPEKVEIPEDLAGKTKAEVTQILTELGLVVNAEFEINDDVEAGKVIRTSPTRPIVLNYGDSITIYVSQGKNSKVEVPDLTGFTIEEAELALNERGLAIVITRANDPKVEEGKVIMQDINAGVILDLSKDSNKVTVVVSLGPEEVIPSNTAVFGNIKVNGAKVTSLGLTPYQLSSAYLTAEITYVNYKGETITTDVTNLLTGYDATTGKVMYTSSWSQVKAVATTLAVNSMTEVTLKLYINYTPDTEAPTEEPTTEEPTTDQRVDAPTTESQTTQPVEDETTKQNGEEATTEGAEAATTKPAEVTPDLTPDAEDDGFTKVEVGNWVDYAR